MSNRLDTNEFEKVEELLIKADVNSKDYEEQIFNRIKYKIETGNIKSNTYEKDELYMKKKTFRPSKVVGLTLATIILGMSVAYATGTLSSILARFQVGNIEITQYGETKEENQNASTEELTLKDMQEGFKGKLFDKNGKEVLYAEVDDYYTADGKEITGMGVRDLENGGHEFYISTEKDESNTRITLEEAKKVADSKITFPNYLPEGYKFKEAYSSFKGAGIHLNYENSNKDKITILASTTKEATSGVASTEEIKEISVDGKKLTVSGNAVFWEKYGTSYQLYWNFEKESTIDMNEVSKIIDSMK